MQNVGAVMNQRLLKVFAQVSWGREGGGGEMGFIGESSTPRNIVTDANVFPIRQTLIEATLHLPKTGP